VISERTVLRATAVVGAFGIATLLLTGLTEWAVYFSIFYAPVMLRVLWNVLTERADQQ